MTKTLEDIFGEDTIKVKPPKSIKITKVQLLEHKLKHSIPDEVKIQIVETRELNRYGKQARDKRARKEDIKSVLVEKGTRPKGRYYDISPTTRINPLEQIFQVDGDTPEGQDEVRIHHFGGSL